MDETTYRLWIAEYESEARKLSAVAYDYREKVKALKTYNEKREARELAGFYERLSKEKLTEARILRDRLRENEQI